MLLQILLLDSPQLWLKLGPNLAADQIKADMKAVLSISHFIRLDDLLLKHVVVYFDGERSVCAL